MPSAFSNFCRLWTIARTLGRFDALIPREYRAKAPFSLKLARLIFGGSHEKGTPGMRLARALEILGPAPIKLGQVLATRPDLVGEEIARSLEGLQDRLASFPTADARKAVAESLGRPVEAFFSSFGEPVAAASIAQVHQAVTIGENPRRVAVKVLRPGVEADFARDLAAFGLAAKLAEWFSQEARRLRFTAVVEMLAEAVEVELDLRMEAAAASELAEHSKGNTDFRVPTVDWDRTARRVLTTEWIDGISIRDTGALGAAGFDPKKIATILTHSFLTQALHDGFFHADLHPGNLFVDAKGRLVAVDFGIMGRLDRDMRRFMAEVLAGFLARDYLRVARAHYRVHFVPPHHPVETFAQALRAIGEPIFERPARDVSMARLLQQLFDTTRRFDMQAQPQLILMQKTMVVAEGVARSLDPDFDIWEAARPVAQRWLGEHIGLEAYLRDAVEDLKALAGAVKSLPRLMQDVQNISAIPESLRAFAEARRHPHHVYVALWLGAAALGVIAVALVV